MKYYIIAGERSGDLHASNLVKSLKTEDSAAEFSGVGGDLMKEAGVNLSFHYNSISFMGFVEVVQNLSKITKALKQVKADILAQKPDVIILVDFAGFNLRIAKFARENGIKVYYYISPKIWAWKQSRVHKIKATVDRMFVIMPFEKEFYEKFDYTTVDYIGNPLLDSVSAFSPNADFKKAHSDKSKNIAILPGSRKQEIKVMMEKLPEIIRLFPDFNFLVAGVSNVSPGLYAGIQNSEGASLHIDKTYDILSCSSAAVVTSGTATLETALFDVPQVVVYKASFITYWIARWLIKVPYISLVNLIAGKAAVKELIQADFNPQMVAENLKLITEGGKGRKAILEDYSDLRNLLDRPGASAKAARLMVGYLRADAGK